MSRPESSILSSSSADAIEAIPMGETVLLLQPGEDGDINSIVIDEKLACQLLPLLQQIVGGR